MEEDIDAVIKRAEHYRFEEKEGEALLNPTSALPTTKKHLKKSIIGRIELLIGAYISLATFMSDETIDYIEKNPKSQKTKRIYLKVHAHIEKLKKEVLDQVASMQ